MRHLIWLLALLQDGGGVSREVPFDERRAIELRLAVADGSRHAACVVTFPEESIEAIVASWNEGDLSLERRRENLFIKLFKNVEGDLHVVGAGGVLYRLYVRPAAGAPDAHVRILKPAASRSGPLTSVELIRAMRRGESPDWATVRTAEERVGSTARAELTARYVYETTHYSGYVVELRNQSPDPLHVDPSRLAANDLVLVGAREMIVPPKGATLLYLVFWR